MDVECKGAFKWSTAAARERALTEYEDAGYGVLSAKDWKAAGAYAFIDTTVELDVDMVSWRASFEEVATSAQEGEVDLKAAEGSFRISKQKGKKKPSVAADPADFGSLYQARLKEWGAAVEKVQKAEAKAKAKRDAERAAALEASNAILVGSFQLGEYGREMLAESDGSVSVLAGKRLARVSTSGIASSHDVADSSGFARLDDQRTVVFGDRGKLFIIEGERIRTIELQAKEDEYLEVEDVIAPRPGELIVREKTSARRISLEKDIELGRIELREVPSYRSIAIGEYPRRRIATRHPMALGLPKTVVFGSNDDDSFEIVVIDFDLAEKSRIQGPGRLVGLARQDDAPFAFINQGSSESALFPIVKKTLGEPVLKLDYEGRSATPRANGDFTLCGGFKSISTFDGRKASSNHDFVAQVADITPQGFVVVADISYSGTIHVLQEPYVNWRADVGTTLMGVTAVGEELIGWGYGSTLYRVRPGGAVSRLIGHGGSIRAVVALGATAFASLDEKGELRFWDLARAS